MYEGDGFIHAGPAASAANPRACDTQGGRGIRDLEGEAWRLRGEVIADLLGKFVAWIRRKALESRSAALDEYLSHSTSLADIEHRLREVERNGGTLPG
jgi:hypothetical protein